MIRIFTIALWLFGVAVAGAQQLTLANNGKTNYKIVYQVTDAQVAAPAALLLQSYLRGSTSADFGIQVKKRTPKGNALILKSIPQDAKHKEGSFSIDASGKDLVFTGVGKGLAYAIYSFLEQSVGCRYYAEDAMVVPKHKVLLVPDNYHLDHSPPIDFRLNYNYEAFQEGYPQWHKLSNVPGENNLTKKTDWGLWVHTMFRLVPPEVHFEQHPEYYSLRNGIRTKDQLCLSNPAVLQITIDSLAAQISRNPLAKYWSVSQMDNYNFCECDRCHTADAEEGSASGSLIRFVNQVAQAFPKKVISTLAYQYSRKAPAKTKPATNVNIMLCTIECNRSKPIASDTSNGSFYRDLEQWATLTNNIIVWDYVINFTNLVSPFPNLNVLQPNIQLFTKFGVTMNFQQGLTGPGGEMKELRAYLISKLLWNPNIEVDSVQKDFIKGYYGPAGKYIDSIVAQMHNELERSGRGLLIYENPFAHAQDYLSPDNFRKYKAWLREASAVVSGDEVLSSRSDRFAQAFRYAELEVAKMSIFSKDWIFEQAPDQSYKVKSYFQALLTEFVHKCRRYGPKTLHETKISPAEYLATNESYFKQGVENHWAVGTDIKFAKPWSTAYPASGERTLIDGVHGFDKWETMWQGWWGEDLEAVIDLKTTRTIQKLQINCMDDNQSWILAPELVRFEVSVDGLHFKEIGVIHNPNASQKVEKQIVPFILQLNNSIDARFVKVYVKNVGQMPKWRGVDGKAWLFADEIVVQ